uniref:Conotoxin pr6a n=1 Tax=Conus parius TaxID=505247 RepID=U6A_CONPI|nr:RecName: Full=Conotoxin pr6a [Conus parius]
TCLARDELCGASFLSNFLCCDGLCLLICV